MRKASGVLLLPLLMIAGCQKDTGQPAPSASAVPGPVTSSQPATAPAAQPKPRAKPAPALTAEELAAIEATGRTGLWSEVTEVCAKDAKSGVSTVLTWNVKDRYDGRVVVYLIDKNGVPRNFGQGGPVGQKKTGPWLQPNMVFKIRTRDTKQDLSEVVIGEKKC